MTVTWMIRSLYDSVSNPFPTVVCGISLRLIVEYFLCLDLVEHMERALVMEQAPPIQPMITEEVANSEGNEDDSTSVIEEDMVCTNLHVL